MARKKREEESGGNWMDTYGDMVTLLLTFFIVLYSFSTVEEEKWADIVRAFNNRGANKVDQIVLTVAEEGKEPAYNDGATNEIDSLFEIIQAYIEENGLEDDITISKSEENEEILGPVDSNIFMEIQDRISFRPDTSILTEGSYEVLDFLGGAIKGVDDKVLCVHGGLSPFIRNVDHINSIYRFQEVANEGLYADLLWSDPEPDITG